MSTALRPILYASLALLIVACGGGGGSGGSGSDNGSGNGGGSGNGNDGGATVTLRSIALTSTSAPLAVGRTRAFTATGTYSDDSTKDLTASATWASSEATVAAVSAGVASGLKQGSTSITATSDGVVSEAMVLEVAAAVDSSADTRAQDGKCTLREMLENAAAKNQSGSTDCPAGTDHNVVIFELDLPATITLGSVLPDVTGEVTILGPGAGQLTVSGNSACQILRVMNGATLDLQGLTLANGKVGTGGALAVISATVSARGVAFRNNAARVGGAISNQSGTLGLTGCSFTGNSAVEVGGAVAAYSTGTTAVTNCTFSGNSSARGGAIYNTLSNLTATYSTFVENTAGGSTSSRGGAIANGFAGVENGGTVHIGASLFWNNTVFGSTENCYTNNVVLADDGYNLEDGTSCGFGESSFPNTKPVLGPVEGALAFAPLQAGSPAIDKIPQGTAGCGTTVTSDARGVARPQGTGCDIGAYERQ